MLQNPTYQLINQILDLPDAPILAIELNNRLEKERKKRLVFYNEISDNEKAEFINGEIIIHSPVLKRHNDANGNLYKILDTYVVERELGYVGIEKIMVQFTRNDYEPDLCFFKNEKAKKFKKNQKLFPIPDLVVEILSKGSQHRDRGIKYQDYEKHGVLEYWLIDAQKEIVEQYILKNRKYKLVIKSKSGIINSIAISGLVFPIPVIFDKKRTNLFVKSLYT